MGSASLLVHQKLELKGAYVLEMKIWSVIGDRGYPDKIKYGLICLNTESGEFLLMDNHKPKGHHYHLNDLEFPYDFVSVEQLIHDFYELMNFYLGVRA